MSHFCIPRRNSWLIVAGLLLATLSLTLPSCSPRCDPASISAVFNLKTELPALMEKATKKMPAEESERVLKQLGDAVVRAKATPRNKEVAEMWRLLNDDIVKPYFDSWKSKGKLDADFIKESVKNVKTSLTSIQGAETSKRGGCAASAPASN